MDNHTELLAPSLTSLSQKNGFLLTVPTKEKDGYLVLQDVGHGNKEVALWSPDLAHKLSTLLRVEEEYAVKSLLPLSDHRFALLVSADSTPSDFVRVVTIDYTTNRIVNNLTIYNLPTDYVNNIYYQDNTHQIVIGNVSIPEDSLLSAQTIDASRFDTIGYDGPYTVDGDAYDNNTGYSHSTYQWAEDQAAWNASHNGYDNTDSSSENSSYTSDEAIDKYFDTMYILNIDRFADPALAKYYFDYLKESFKKDPTVTLDQLMTYQEYTGGDQLVIGQSGEAHRDSEYSTGSPSANSNGNDTGYSYSTHEWVDSMSDYYGQSQSDDYSYQTSIGAEQYDYEPGKVTLKKGTWHGVGHQFWKVDIDYDIELAIADNEYYFTYVDDRTTCYGSMTVVGRTENSITFREHLSGGKCVENYFVLTQVDDDHFLYNSYLLDGTPTVNGDIYFVSTNY